MTDTVKTDVLVIGAGIAGTGAAAALAPTHRVVILEREDQPGYHSTGRSVAIFLPNYSNDVIRGLNEVSAPLFEERDTSLFAEPLLTARGCLTVADETGISNLEDFARTSAGVEIVDLDRALQLMPILNRDHIK